MPYALTIAAALALMWASNAYINHNYDRDGDKRLRFAAAFLWCCACTAIPVAVIMWATR